MLSYKFNALFRFCSDNTVPSDDLRVDFHEHDIDDGGHIEMIDTGVNLDDVDDAAVTNINAASF